MSTYICVLVDDREAAARANEHFDTLTTGTFRIQAFRTGQIMHGLHHRGQRPTLILDHTTNTHPKYDDWYNHCVKGSAMRATLLRMTGVTSE